MTLSRHVYIIGRWMSMATLLTSSASAQTKANGGSATIFAWTAHSNRLDEVCLELPSPLIDWKAAAASGLGGAFVNKPHPDSLRRRYIGDFGGSSSFGFTVSAPDSIRRTPWLVLHDRGLTVVHASRLRGEATWGLKRDSVTITGSEFTGLACTARISPAINAAFFMSGERAAAWTTSVGPEARLLPAGTANKANTNAFEVRLDGLRYRFTEDAISGSPRTRIFRRPGATLLMAIWASEACDFYYTLYQVEPRGRLRSIGVSADACED